MENIDRSLDDIIKSSSKRTPSGSAPSRRGRTITRKTPYSSSRGRGGGRGRGRGRGGRFGARGGGRDGGGRRVFVQGLDYNTTWQTLKDYMRFTGNVVHANLLTNPDGSSKGCAIVEYENAFGARRAVQELSNTEIDGRTVFVREDREENGATVQTTSARGGPVSRGGGTSVYVGNLPWSITWQELKDISAEYGTVTRADIAMNNQGSSKGYGIVSFASSRDANNFISNLDQAELQGRVLSVRLDQLTGNGASGGGYDSKSQPRQRQTQNGSGVSIFIGNIPWSVDWQKIKDLCREFAEPQFVEIPENFEGRSKGFATARFATQGDARKAIDGLNGYELEGRTLNVREDKFSSA